jgi:hypothetical protein
MSEELVVNNPTTQADVNQAVSLVVQDKLQKAGITDQTLSELKTELEDLSKIEVVDEASFKLIHGGAMKATNARTTITKICKAGREYAISEQKAWIAAERDTISSFSAQENALKAKKDGWIAKKEREEREELERKEQAIRARLVAIEQFGFSKRTGSIDKGADYYTNGITTVEMSAITMSDDEVWSNLLNSLRMVWEEGQAAKAEKERVATEEAERIRLAQEAIEDGQRRLKEQQDAFNAKINESRKNELLAVGAVVEGGIIKVPGSEVGLDLDTLFSQDQGTWDVNVEFVKGQVEQVMLLREKAEEAAARERLIAERVKALKEAGWEDYSRQGEGALLLNQHESDGVTITTATFTQEIARLADMPDDVFASRIADGKAELARRKKVEQDRIAAEAVEAERKRQEEEAKRIAAEEQERKAKLTDLDKWNEWVASIKASAPKLSSEIATHAVGRVLKGLDAMTPNLFVEPKK